MLYNSNLLCTWYLCQQVQLRLIKYLLDSFYTTSGIYWITSKLPVTDCCVYDSVMFLPCSCLLMNQNNLNKIRFLSWFQLAHRSSALNLHVSWDIFVCLVSPPQGLYGRRLKASRKMKPVISLTFLCVCDMLKRRKEHKKTRR